MCSSDLLHFFNVGLDYPFHKIRINSILPDGFAGKILCKFLEEETLSKIDLSACSSNGFAVFRTSRNLSLCCGSTIHARLWVMP